MYLCAFFLADTDHVTKENSFTILDNKHFVLCWHWSVKGGSLDVELWTIKNCLRCLQLLTPKHHTTLANQLNIADFLYGLRKRCTAVSVYERNSPSFRESVSIAYFATDFLLNIEQIILYHICPAGVMHFSGNQQHDEDKHMKNCKMIWFLRNWAFMRAE